MDLLWLPFGIRPTRSPQLCPALFLLPGPLWPSMWAEYRLLPTGAPYVSLPCASLLEKAVSFMVESERSRKGTHPPLKGRSTGGGEEGFKYYLLGVHSGLISSPPCIYPWVVCPRQSPAQKTGETGECGGLKAYAYLLHIADLILTSHSPSSMAMYGLGRDPTLGCGWGPHTIGLRVLYPQPFQAAN